MHLSFKKTDFMNLFHKRVVLTTTSWELGLLSTLTRHRNKNPMQSLAANSSANVKVVNTKYKCVPLRHKLMPTNNSSYQCVDMSFYCDNGLSDKE